MWNPDEEYWGDEEQPQDPWVRNVIARGPGPEFEMEQVLPEILAGRAWHENAERW